MEVRRRCRDAVDAVEAAIDPDRPGRPDDRGHDCESERDDGRNGEHAPPAGWRRQDDGDCQDEQSFERHTERQRGDDASCETADRPAERDEQRVSRQMTRGRSVCRQTPVQGKPGSSERRQEQGDRDADRRRDHVELAKRDGHRQGDQGKGRAAWRDRRGPGVGEDQRREVHDERSDPQQRDCGDVRRDIGRDADEERGRDACEDDP